MNIDEIRTRLHELAMATPVIDAHTHVQDDLTGFTPELAAGNLAGTQASVNRPPQSVVQEGLLRRVGENVSRRIDVRLVSATNRDLTRETAEGHFRIDLYYRLNVIRIVVPPLR